MKLAYPSVAARVAVPLLLTLAGLPAQADQRFVPNAAGDEITDSATGLIWRRCAEGQVWNGSTCAGAASSFTWDSALTQARSQTSQSGLPWRLPNRNELESLVERSGISPVIDATAFPNTFPATSFWSSTAVAGDAYYYAWIVSFYYGEVYYDFRNGWGNAARLVRGGQ